MTAATTAEGKARSLRALHVLVGYHEAGHAVAGVVLGSRLTDFRGRCLAVWLLFYLALILLEA